MLSSSHTLCCEALPEERSAGNPHATFCGNRWQATATDDPVSAGQQVLLPGIRRQKAARLICGVMLKTGGFFTVYEVMIRCIVLMNFAIFYRVVCCELYGDANGQKI